MKQIDDDLIARISIIWSIFISIWMSCSSTYDEGRDYEDIRPTVKLE